MRYYLVLGVASSILLGIQGLCNSSFASAQTIYTPSSSVQPPEFIQRLKLTPEQVTRLEAIQRKTRTQLDQVEPELDRAEGEFETLMNSPDATAAQIQDKYQQIRSLRQRLDEVIFKSRLETRNVLRIEQRVPFEQEMKKLRDAYRKRVDGGRS